uniref:transposase n=2 Tax=Pseudomonadota TaxID=1224 RepID=UPI0018E96EB3
VFMAKKRKNKYNHYTEDFRREAVRRSEDPDTSAVEVARELGIHPGQIYNWRRQYKRLSDKQFNSMQGVDYSRQESEEMRALKREIADLKEENEFLKKATAYFSKDKW